jgi:phosphatidylglycerophosphate synthase
VNRYSLKDIINSRDAHKKYIDKIDLWVFVVVRPLANLLTWFFLRLKMSANFATLISTIVGFIGAAVLIFGTTKWMLLLGLVIMNLWIVFDCIDGNIARTTKKSSPLGTYFDGLSGYSYVALLYTALGVAVFKHYNLEIGGVNYSWLYMLLGALTSMMCILPRLFEYKALSSFENYKSEITDKDNYSLFYIIGLNVGGMAGLSNPLMIVAFFGNVLNLYLIIYFVIQTFIGLYSIRKTLKNVINSQKES